METAGVELFSKWVLTQEGPWCLFRPRCGAPLLRSPNGHRSHSKHAPLDRLYRIEFDDGRPAFIDVRDFERRLYRELRPNEVAVAPNFEPPLGRGVQVHQFERASIFASDPDVVWARVRDQGPRTFQPMQSGVQVPVVPPVVKPADPVAPVIGPR